MRKIHILISFSALILLVGCAGPKLRKKIYKEYQPKSKMPIKYEKRQYPYLEGYDYFGYFEIKGRVKTVETAALKKAAKYGADVVRLTEWSSGRGDKWVGSESWYEFPTTGPMAYRTIKRRKPKAKTVVWTTMVSLYRHNPNKDYTRGFEWCFFRGGFCRSTAVEKLLSKGADPNIRSSEGYTPLYTIVSDMRDRGNSARDTCLSFLILLNAGADPSIVPKQSPSLIELIGKKRHEIRYDKSQVENVECLDEISALLHKDYTRGFERCFFSGFCESWDVKELLSKGADPNIRNLEGHTLLYDLVRHSRNRTGNERTTCETFQMLLDAGADPNIVPKQSPSLIKLIRKIRHEIRYDKLQVENFKCLGKLLELLLSRDVKA
jgi:hypothetical protein